MAPDFKSTTQDGAALTLADGRTLGGRLLVGADHRRLLPTAFWLGGGFMIVVDDLARSLTQAEIPVGIITALLGAPLFTWLLIHSRRRGMV